jgi:hypothetical protein
MFIILYRSECVNGNETPSPIRAAFHTDKQTLACNAAKRDFAKEIREGRLPEFSLSPCPGRKPPEDKDELR